MSVSLRFYLDAALSVEATPAEFAVLLGAGSVERQLWLGSVEDGRVFHAADDPLGAPIMVEVVETAPGGAVSPSDIRLALTAGALASAAPGAPLNVGAEIQGGAEHAVPLWLRWTPSGAGVGAHAGLALQTTEVVETAVESPT